MTLPEGDESRRDAEIFGVCGLEEAKLRKRREYVELRGVAAKESKGLNALLGKRVVNVYREVIPDDGRGKVEARSPFADEIFNVG
jgi:hypothetical protein